MPDEKDETQTPEPSEAATEGSVSDPREQFKRLCDRARSGEMLRDNAQAQEDQEEEQAAYYESHPWDRATVFKYWDEPPVPVEDVGPRKESSAIRRVKRGAAQAGAFQLMIHRVHEPKVTTYGNIYSSASATFSRWVDDQEMRTWVLVKAYDDTNGEIICELEKGEPVTFSGRLKTESKMGDDGQPVRQYYLTLSGE
jgi:hypothetical protein